MKIKGFTKNSGLSGKNGFFSLLGILITAAIIAFLMFYLLKVYSGRPAVSAEAGHAISAAGINTTSYQGILDSTRTKIKSVSAESQNKVKELEELR